MLMVRCLSQYHNNLSADYDGRLEVVWEGPSSRMERCKVCKHELLSQYASREEPVKIEIEDWRDQAIERHNARVQARQSDR